MKRSGFSLVELLTVIAIISLLLAILLPALGRAKASAKMSTCASNLRQLGIGSTSYANMYKGFIPLGPGGKNEFGVDYTQIATNQIWVGKPQGETKVRGYCGLGILLTIKSASPAVFYCPADESEDETEEAPKLETDEHAYSSYLYRQAQMIPGKPVLGDFGYNNVKRANGSDTSIKIEALAMDVQVTGPSAMRHITHQGERVNILMQDTSVQPFFNRNEFVDAPANTMVGGIFGLQDLHFQKLLSSGDPSDLKVRLGELFLRADFSAVTDPGEAPINRVVALTK